MEQKNHKSFESIKITRVSDGKPPAYVDDDVAAEKAITISTAAANCEILARKNE